MNTEWKSHIITKLPQHCCLLIVVILLRVLQSCSTKSWLFQPWLSRTPNSPCPRSGTIHFSYWLPPTSSWQAFPRQIWSSGPMMKSSFCSSGRWRKRTCKGSCRALASTRIGNRKSACFRRPQLFWFGTCPSSLRTPVWCSTRGKQNSLYVRSHSQSKGMSRMRCCSERSDSFDSRCRRRYSDRLGSTSSRMRLFLASMGLPSLWACSAVPLSRNSPDSNSSLSQPSMFEDLLPPSLM